MISPFEIACVAVAVCAFVTLALVVMVEAIEDADGAVNQGGLVSLRQK
jgi:hypothetical protein